MGDSFTSQDFQDLLKRYNREKNKNCAPNTDCYLNKRLLELDVNFRRAELGLKTGEMEMWNAEREKTQLQYGTGALKRKVNEMADDFINNLEETFNDIMDNLTLKAESVDNQKGYIREMNEMIDFYNDKHNNLQNKYDKIINTNSINKRLATFYEADEEYIKPFINILEKVYWPILILSALSLSFKLFTGKYPTMRDKIYPISSLLFLFFAPFLFRQFANSFQPYEYTGYQDSDVDDPKRYKNLVE